MEESLRFNSISLLFFIILITGCGKAFAFKCKTASYEPVSNTSATFNISISPASINKGTLTLNLVDLASQVRCYGVPGTSLNDGTRWNDALGLESIQLLSTELKNRGFDAFVQVDNDGIDRMTITPQTICVWWNENCSVGPNMSASQWRNILSTKIGIKRTENTGVWQKAVKIPAGTEVARLVTRIRTNGWINAYLTFRLVLSADMVIPATTCNIDNLSKKVTLRDVRLRDMINHGAGRYTASPTEFSYQLTCDTATSVSVKLEGNPLSSTSGPLNNVLENTIIATKNIGVQVTFNDTPMSILSSDPAVTVINNAVANETLKFKAYYYYNGDSGTSAGPVKSQATITFDYF